MFPLTVIVQMHQYMPTWGIYYGYGPDNWQLHRVSHTLSVCGYHKSTIILWFSDLVAQRYMAHKVCSCFALVTTFPFFLGLKILSEKNRLSSTIWKMSGMMKLYDSYHSLWYEILAMHQI